jgi:hypothetical protein
VSRRGIRFATRLISRQLLFGTFGSRCRDLAFGGVRFARASIQTSTVALCRERGTLILSEASFSQRFGRIHLAVG